MTKFVVKDMGDAADASLGQFDIHDTLKGIYSAVVIVAIALLTIHFGARLLVLAVSDEVEKDWLGPVLSPFSANRISVQSPPPRAQEIFDKVLEAACQQTACRDLDYQLRYLNDPNPNAFAVIGGDIVITNELYESLETEEGLAFVFAHEIAHHNQRHILTALSRQVLWAIFLSIAGVYDSSQLGVFYLEMNHSRSAEEEADRLALQTVYAIYGDEREAFVELFNRMLNDKNHAEHWHWVSTHPETTSRIEAIHRQLDEWVENKK